MSKRIKTLVMALVIATMTSTGAFALEFDHTVYGSVAEVQADGSEIEYTTKDGVKESIGSITKTLTPAGDGTSIYESKVNDNYTSTVTINNIARSEKRLGQTMLWSNGPVTVNLSQDKQAERTIFHYNQLNSRVSGGKLVLVNPQMDFNGWYMNKVNVCKAVLWDSDYTYQKDKTITLTEPGYYTIVASPNSCTLYIGNPGEDLTKIEPKVENAVASSLNVTFANKTTSLPAYNINGESYIRTKDLAYILNKTTRQFSVIDNNNIRTYTGYAPNGSELKALPSENAATPLPSGNAVATPYTETFMLNNEMTQPSIYTINNEQFISLSDMNFFLNLGLSVNGNAVTMNNVSNMANSAGKIVTKQIAILGKNVHGPDFVLPSYAVIQVDGMTDEQIKEKLSAFDAKQLWIAADISDKLRAELKEEYELV